jgi:hypothetical protein
LVIWLSLLSYRDVALAWRYPAYPHLRWIGIMTSEGWMAVVATYLASVVLMSLAGFWAWRYLLAHFDQLVGRPWRQTPVQEVARIAAEPADSLSFDY